MPKKKLTPEQELLAEYMSATTAAFQMLVICLQRNGALEQGQFPEALSDYIAHAKESGHSADSVKLTLIDDLRRSLLY